MDEHDSFPLWARWGALTAFLLLRPAFVRVEGDCVDDMRVDLGVVISCLNLSWRKH